MDLDPDHDGAWSALGFVYEAQNKLDDAVAVYKEALKANPDNAAFVERLGDLLVKLGRYGEAQSEIESLVDSLPRDPRVWLKLGAIHYEQKQYDKAVAAFRQAVSLEPGNMRTRYYLATALMDSGKDDEARSELEKILKADPRSVDARVQLGFLYGRAKRYDEAVATLQEAVNLEPKRPELFLYLGTALQRASQYDRAGDRAARGALGGRQEQGSPLPARRGAGEAAAVRRRHQVVPPRARHRSQARRVVQLHRLHVRGEGHEPLRGHPAHPAGARARARERLLHRQPGLGLLPAGRAIPRPCAS